MDNSEQNNRTESDIDAVVQRAIAEYARQESDKREPALKAELLEERHRREVLEKRLNQMAEENRRNRELAEQADRSTKIRNELQTLGVAKVDLAFKAIQNDIFKNEEGNLTARTDRGEVGLRDYLTHFVHENPEFLPARISGGTGLVSGQRVSPQHSPVDLEHITPTMSKDDKERVRQEILRIATQSFKGI